MNRRDFSCKAGLAFAGTGTFLSLNRRGEKKEDVAAGIFNVYAFGAKGDGNSLDTQAIQAAIDACTGAGGGMVYAPPGTYLTGTLHLKSNVTLYVEAGATLLGSTRMQDYDPGHVIFARGAENIGIAGPGTIDGNGSAFWIERPVEEVARSSRRTYGWVPTFSYDHPEARPGNLIRLIDSKRVHIKDVQLQNAESWTLHLLGCDEVQIRGIRIRNPFHGPNTDGIDIDACSNVVLSDCDILTADDAICLKNEHAEFDHRSCRNITVNNCIISTACNGFKIGTGTHGDFQNIVFSNSVIRAADPDSPWTRLAVQTIDPEHHGNALAPLSGIAVETVDGGDVRGVSVSNIVMEEVRAPIFVRLGNRGGRGERKVANPVPGTLQDVSIENVTAYGTSTPSSITGLPGHPVKNVSIRNVHINTIGGGSSDLALKELEEKIDSYPEATMWGRMPVYGLFVRHVDGLLMQDIRVTTESADARPALSCDDVTRLRMRRFTPDPQVKAEHLIHLHDVRDAVLQDTQPPAGTKTWVKVSGELSEDILLIPNDPKMLVGAEIPVQVCCGAVERAVRVSNA